MKKQILTLAMCLAVTSTAALAATPAKVAPATKAAVSKTATATAKVLTPVKTTSKTVVVKAPEKTPDAKPTPEQMKKDFEARMVKERNRLYCDLGLTADQIKKAEELHVKSMEKGEPLMENVRLQKAKLFELKTQKASEAEITKQKAEVKAARKLIKKHMLASRKEFDAILTKEQLAKLKAIKAAKKAERKAFCKTHCKNGHKHGGPEGFMGPKPPMGEGPEGFMGPKPPMSAEPPKCPCGK